MFRAANRDRWPEVRSELTEAYRLSKAAAEQVSPVVYVIDLDALLGRLGPGPAMIASGLTSAAKTLALELKKKGAAVNTLVVGADTGSDTVAEWTLSLLGGGPQGPTGEVITLGGDQIGKALS